MNHMECTTPIAKLNLKLCCWSQVYVIKVMIITITRGLPDVADEGKQTDKRNERVIFKNCATFTDRVSKINNTQDLDVVMEVYNLIECSNNYSKTCGSFWQYCRDCQVRQIILL